MEILLELFKTYGTQLSALGAAIAFIFGLYKFHTERKESHYWNEFETYHKLVKELVEPQSENGTLYIDRQTAILYELRFYKRYFPHSLRMLKALKEKWITVPNQFPRILEEIDLTIDYISNR